MKVIVFGSKGYLGHNLTRHLQLAGIYVEEISSRDGTGIDPTTGLLPINFEIIPDKNITVIYLSQSPRFRNVPDEASHIVAVNTLSAVRAATAARKAGAHRFIYVSTGTVYSSSFEPIDERAPVRRDIWYTLTKLHGEESLALFRDWMDVIIVRPFTIYGPLQTGRLIPNLIDSVRSGRPISIHRRNPADNTDGGLKISLCHINDAVALLHHLISHGGPNLLNLSSDEALSIFDIASTIGQFLSITPQFQIMDLPRDADLIADISLLKQTIPHPFIPFERGLRDILTFDSL